MNEILTEIIVQLLRLGSEDVRDRKRFNEVHQSLISRTWTEDPVSLCKILVAVLGLFEETTIILDRIDRAKFKGRAPRFVETLLQALSESDCVARILLVAKPTSMAAEWELDMSDEVKQKVTYLGIDGWDWDQNQDEQGSTPRRRRRQGE